MSTKSAIITEAERLLNTNAVDGWVGRDVHSIIDFAHGFHEDHGIRGDIAEIGVHHGKLFFLLASASREDERCVAIDLFEHQELNVDLSGSGSREKFTGYLDDLFPDLKDRVDIVSGDSMALTPVTARSSISAKGVRLFSVDGGHTCAHVINDLSLAQELIVSGGLVLLDDFLGPHWPSVTEGFFNYMAHYNKRLAPIAIFQNKLFLTTFSEHTQMLEALHRHIEASFGDDIHHHWKYATVCGFKVLCRS